MKAFRLLSVVVLAVCVWGAAIAAPVAPTVRSEINVLLKRMQAAGCTFNRNGTWYSGTDAQAHLLKKLEYFEGKSMVKTTEDFITLAASTSSSSGKPYWVRCGDAQPVNSGIWLQEQLKLLREAK